MKVRNIYDRILLVFLSVAFTFMSVFGSCVVANADDVDPDASTVVALVQEFRDSADYYLDQLEQSLASDINNGNIDATTALGRQYLRACALQYLYISGLGPLLTAADEVNTFMDYLQEHPTTTISGQNYSGFYTYNNTYYPCYYNITDNGVILDSALFKFSVSSTGYNLNVVSQGYNSSYEAFKTLYYCSSASNNASFTLSWTSSIIRNTLPSSSSFYQGGSKYLFIGYSPNRIPAISSYYDNSYYIAFTSSAPWSGDTAKALFGSGVQVTLESESIDSTTPWDYYNDYLMPQLQSECPDITNNYYLFPNGYYPAQDPTEPPLPDGNNGGLTVNNNWNFNIGINNITVTDASGQPVTDASGEVVTETVIETETRPSDAVYHFQIPTLTPLETQVATIPPYQVPAEYAGYMGDAFTAITDFIDDAGLTDIAPVFLALAGIGLVIGVLL